MTKLIGRLMAGPLDVVGDVHGEFDALQDLLRHLGYGPDGRHSDGRHLVFVGDLVDRGSDSPAVVRLVQSLVQSDAAQMVLGNHEINLLRGEYKDGNGWFYGDPEHRDRKRGKFLGSKPASDAERESFLAFFASLPLALEREDLRIVHACWGHQAIEKLRGESRGPSTAFDAWEAKIRQQLDNEGIEARADSEEQASGDWLNEPGRKAVMLPAVAERDELKQMGNPLRIVTSGVERKTTEPFFSGGQWRFVERVRWWDEYEESTPVIVGHYWRWAADIDRKSIDKGGPDLFEGLGIVEWHGTRRNAFCVDYSVGRRFLDREKGRPYHRACRLGALRWPEQEVVFDDGECVPTLEGSALVSDTRCFSSR